MERRARSPERTIDAGTDHLALIGVLATDSVLWIMLERVPAKYETLNEYSLDTSECSFTFIRQGLTWISKMLGRIPRLSGPWQELTCLKEDLVVEQTNICCLVSRRGTQFIGAA